MRFTWRRASRLPAIPLWALAIVLAWAALLASIQFVPALRQPPFARCTFLELTGSPCPSCGGTRAVLALGRGRPAEALGHNPMIVVGLWALGLYLVTRLATGRRPEIRVTRREAGLALVLLAALFLANWAWVMHRL